MDLALAAGTVALAGYAIEKAGGVNAIVNETFDEVSQ